MRLTPGVTPDHPRCRADRPARLQVRLWPDRRPGRRGVARLSRRPPTSSSVGVHAHIGSQIFDLSSYRREVEVLIAALAHWRRDARLRVPPAQPGRRPRHPLHRRRPSPRRSPSSPTVATTALDVELARRDLPLPTVLVEPGRSIVGKAAVTALPRRHHQGGPRRAHLRGGRRRHVRQPAAHALRLALRGHDRQPGRHAGDVSDDRGRQALRVGRRAGARRARSPRPSSATCWSRRPPAPTATPWPTTTTGQPRPAVVMVAGGEARVIIERETWDDVLRLQRPLAGRAARETLRTDSRLGAGRSGGWPAQVETTRTTKGRRWTRSASDWWGTAR